MKASVKNRSLQPEEVEIRVDSISKSGKSVTVVPYIKKETAWNYLDELYGAGNWDKTVTMDKKSADTPFYSICRIHVHTDDVDFFREDAGEGDSPKAAASDALKRAAMNIVPAFRALGTVPTLRINENDVADALDLGPEKTLKDTLRFAKFKVLSISFGTSVAGDFIKAMTIAEEKTGDIVHEYVNKGTREYRQEVSADVAERVTELRTRMAEAKYSEENMLKHYGIKDLSELAETEKRYNDALLNLKERKRKIDNMKKQKKKEA